MTLPLDPDELLTTTRSVRKRLALGRPVPIELVREPGGGSAGPTGSNQQGWQWMVVTSPIASSASGTDSFRPSTLESTASSASSGDFRSSASSA